MRNSRFSTRSASCWLGIAACSTLVWIAPSAQAQCSYRGVPINVSNVCDYQDDFQNGDLAADVDDGTFSGIPDGGVSIDDLLYYLSCIPVVPGTAVPGVTIGPLQNDDCATPAIIQGVGRFSYAVCGIPIMAAAGNPLPATTSAGRCQLNPGGGTCNGGPYDSAIPYDLWFLWTAPTSGWYLFNTVNPSVSGGFLSFNDTRVAVYGFSGPNTSVPPCPATTPGPLFSGPALGYNNDSGGDIFGIVKNKQSRVALQAVAGNQYLIQIGVPGQYCTAQCEYFEITPAVGPSYTSPGWPSQNMSVEVTPVGPSPALTVGSVISLSCGTAPTCTNQPMRRCVDLSVTPAPAAQTQHFIVRIRYTGLLPAWARRMMVYHSPSSGSNAGLWVNARCGVQLSSTPFSLGGFFVLVVDSFSPFAFVDPVCFADVDDGTSTGSPDGGVTVDDLNYFLSTFEFGYLDADIDDGSNTGTPDGGVTIDDLIYYLTRFEAGC